MAGNNIGDDFEQWRATNNIVTAAAQKHGVDPDLIRGMIRQESAGNSRATSNKGAQGLMQLMPATAKDLGVTDPFDPGQNIEAGTRYMSQLLKRYGGDRNKALAAYNAGMGNVDSGKASKFKETQDYVRRIGGNLDAPQSESAVPSDLSRGITVTGSGLKQVEPDIAEDFENWRSQQAPTTKPTTDADIASFNKKNQDSRGFLQKLQDGTAQAILHPIDTTVDNLPAIGGAIGGMVGGAGGTVAGFGVGGVPGAVGGAALGGSAGEAAQQLIHRFQGKAAPSTMTGAALNIGGEGALQAANEVGGRAIGGAAKWTGKQLVKAAFKPTAKMLDQSPKLVEELIANKVNPTERGARKAFGRTTASRVKADAAVDAADTPGNEIDLMDIIKALGINPKDPSLMTSFKHVAGQAERTPGMNRIGRTIDNILADNPAKLGLKRVHQMSRAEGKASNIFTQGNVENPTLDAMIHADLRTGAEIALENKVPELAGINKVTRSHLLQGEAAERAAAAHKADVPGMFRRHMLAGSVGAAMFPAGIPAALGTAGFIELGANPTTRAVTGRAAYNFGKLPFSNLARGAEASAQHSGGPQDQEQTSGLKKAQVDSLYERYLQDNQ